MGKNTKKCRQFIESIPDSKLEGLSSTEGLIFGDRNWRLDMQGVCLKILISLGWTNSWR